jgi:hypothetical protein
LGVQEIQIPGLIATDDQRIPYKTIVMLINFIVSIVVSAAVNWFFHNSLKRLKRYDVLHVMGRTQRRVAVEQHTMRVHSRYDSDFHLNTLK